MRAERPRKWGIPRNVCFGGTGELFGSGFRELEGGGVFFFFFFFFGVGVKNLSFFFFSEVGVKSKKNKASVGCCKACTLSWTWIADLAVGQKHVPEWHFGSRNQRVKPAVGPSSSILSHHFAACQLFDTRSSGVLEFLLFEALACFNSCFFSAH